MPNTDNRKFGADPIDIRDFQKGKVHMSRSFKNKGKGAIREEEPLISNEQIDDALFLDDAGLAVSYINTVPPVLNQLGEGSCVAWALGYYLMSHEWYKKLGSVSYSQSVNTFSPEYLFNHTKTSTACSGSSIVTASNFIANNGNVLWTTLPYEQGNCSITATQEQIDEAITYKMSPYTIILSKDTAALKAALANNHCLVFQVAADDYILNPTAPYIWNASNATGVYYGAHAMCVVGYDDTKNAFKVVNQWGTSWGEAGFFWIDYTHYGNVASSSFLVTPAVVATAPTANAGYDRTVPAGSTATLDGSSSKPGTGATITFAWTQSSGPNSATISSATTPVTNVSNLIAGTYIFKLTVTDNNSLVSVDTVAVIVTAVSTDSYTITVSRTTSRGTGKDLIGWKIASTTTPVSVQIQAGATTSTFNTIYTVTPYSPQGTFSYSTKKTLNYRLKITKADGTIVYSNVVHS